MFSGGIDKQHGAVIGWYQKPVWIVALTNCILNK